MTFVDRRRWHRLIVYLAILMAGLQLIALEPVGAQDVSPGRDAVHILTMRGVINPPAATYMQRALQNAAALDARLIVIELDTPGGLESAMRDISQAILASPVPVAVYVAPSGAHAASAGLFILQSGHIAAMAPSTNTGSAHPVSLGEAQPDETQVDKAVHDAAAMIRALASARGRNAEWAEQAVRESVSLTESEALDHGVIDLVARDLDHLLAQIQGKSVETAAGAVTLDVIAVPRYDAAMTFAEQLLHVISTPNIAFVLLSVGTLGLIAELYNPGMLFPGITGLISLIFAFFALGNLPTNWAGVALIVVAMILLVAELLIESSGVLGVGATVAFLLGGLMLFRPFGPSSPVAPNLSVDLWLLGSATVMLAGFIFFVLYKLIRARKEPIHTGHERFVNQLATVREDLNPSGRVWFDNQFWYAEVRPARYVPAGQQVRIVATEGIRLIVKPVVARAGTPQNEQTREPALKREPNVREAQAEP